jgi:hypothetical protein
MYRALAVLWISLVVMVGAAIPSVAHAVTILPDELENFGTPCTLSVSQNGSVRTLSWSVVSGASTYKVGYRLGSSIIALAQVSGTSYDHTGWSASDCLEYVMVACNGSGAKVCAAHVSNVGSCPQ